MTLAASRRKVILELLRDQGAVSLSELSLRFPSLSTMTLRRDLERLQAEGRCTRTHGGAVLATGSLELPYSVRATHNYRRKLAIARLARGLIHPGMTISLDASSTAYVLASHLQDLTELTLLTTNPTMPVRLSFHHSSQVMICGGIWRHVAQSVVGPMADSFLGHFKVDIAFVATRSMSPERGLSDADLMEVSTKKAALRGATRKIALMDSTKLPSDSVITVAGADELDLLITDSGLKPGLARRFKKVGLEVAIASMSALDLRSDARSA